MHLHKPVSISKAVILLSHLSRSAGVPPPKSPPGPPLSLISTLPVAVSFYNLTMRSLGAEHTAGAQLSSWEGHSGLTQRLSG